MGSKLAESSANNRRGSRQMIIGIVAAVGITAALVYKLIWPWTGWRTDVTFLGITLIGIFAASRLKKRE
jgi:hypothetical protein